jgi:hypothetical protein
VFTSSHLPRQPRPAPPHARPGRACQHLRIRGGTPPTGEQDGELTSATAGHGTRRFSVALCRHVVGYHLQSDPESLLVVCQPCTGQVVVIRASFSRYSRALMVPRSYSRKKLYGCPPGDTGRNVPGATGRARRAPQAATQYHPNRAQLPGNCLRIAGGLVCQTNRTQLPGNCLRITGELARHAVRCAGARGRPAKLGPLVTA